MKKDYILISKIESEIAAQVLSELCMTYTMVEENQDVKFIIEYFTAQQIFSFGRLFQLKKDINAIKN